VASPVPRDVRWYFARLRAMSATEVGWRTAAGLRRQLRPAVREERALDWDAGPWPTLVRALAAGARPSLVADARRIASGELHFFGREVQVDPHALPWLDGPFAAEAAAGAAWAHDPKCRWELHRQQHLFPLAAGGYRGAEPEWPRLALGQILDWIERHPAGGAAGWESGYEAAHRLVAWAWALPFALGSASVAERTEIDAYVAETAAFVRERPSLYSSANNHRLAELAGLLAFEAVAVERAGWAPWWEAFESEVARQTFPDGGSHEQAGGYFLYVLEIVWVAALLAHAVGQDLGRLAVRVESMLEWLQAIAGEDGEPPAVGDDAEDRFVRVDYFEPRKAAEIAGRTRALLQGAPTLAAPAAPGAAEESRVLRESGYVVMRGRHRSSPVRLVFDAGPLGLGSLAAHGHADALAVTVDVGAETLLRDAGTGSYLPAAGRDGFRITSAHNSVVVDGESQAEPLGPHLWGRRFEAVVEAVDLGGEVDYVRARHDGYRSRRAHAVHVRSLTYIKPDLAVVLDRVTAERDCTVELVWQTMPGHALEAPGAASAVAVAAVPAASRRDGDGPFSTRYTWVGEAPRTTFETTGRDVVFATALALSRPDPLALELRHQAGETIVDVAAGARLRLVERWTGGAVSVEPG
jgi:hypothetical protein